MNHTSKPEKTALFQTHFGRYVSISDQAMDFLTQAFKEQSFEARSFVVEAGTVARSFYIVQSGVQGMYVINPRGEKVFLGFTFAGNISGVYDSFITQKPSAYFLEALTPSALLAISRADYDTLFERFPEFLQWRALFMEQLLFGRGHREVEMLTQTAQQRFDAFVARCPPELLQIPQKYLASYLNMKPETFSRLRAKRS